MDFKVGDYVVLGGINNCVHRIVYECRLFCFFEMSSGSRFPYSAIERLATQKEIEQGYRDE